ncbi:MAG: aminotransferase class IV [Bacteroidetes bacterium]|nr:aminotransferase class IV [Bacteroidota bacterium]MBT3748543.1 aminotransferase class IV [Bacteroidota bacterium]MBT4398984.1 aminotransferase class IV [Bacteroidota bacterium]MBT4411252.1 aminotransferase class IV [Bacteroidota bacterium]MBT7094901.1 aminotransferase class IV [Bacteroidota bacterium]
MIWHNGNIAPGNLLTYPRSSESGWIYEVLRIKDHCPVFFKQHYDRLISGTKISGTSLRSSEHEILEGIFNLLNSAENSEGNIRIQVEIGSGTIMIGFIPHKYPDPEEFIKGVSTGTILMERTDPNIKTWNLNVREEADRIIKSSKLKEVILLDNSGNLTEGSRSNIFAEKKGCLYTPPLASVLPGITRQIIIDLANSLGIPVIEQTISYPDLESFDSFFLTGTSPGVLPINIIDQYMFNNKSDKCALLRKAYENRIEENIKEIKQLYIQD